jgi:hypothetical protein
VGWSYIALGQNAVSRVYVEHKNACWSDALKLKRKVPCNWEALMREQTLEKHVAINRLVSTRDCTACWHVRAKVAGVSYGLFLVCLVESHQYKVRT